MENAAKSLRSVAQSLRASAGWKELSPRERLRLDEDLRRIDRTLAAGGGTGMARAQATPADLHAAELINPEPKDQGQAAPPPAAPAAPPPPAATDVIGGRAAAAMEAVNFTGFVAGLVTGTFQAIVDASAQQIREYAQLVASLARSVDDFARENVAESQVRDWLANRHPAELMVAIPAAGTAADPRLLPRPGHEESSPQWLADYGLEGEGLTEELTEGALLRAGRPRVAEERMQTLATMVLMGINRVVINDGTIRAKMQFHASARDRMTAEAVVAGMGQQVGIAQRQVQVQSATSTMVSTVKANAQADASIKADLMGEVHINFRSETFPLERFADSAAIQLLNRHARLQAEPAKPEQKAANGTTGNGATEREANGGVERRGVTEVRPPEEQGA